MIRLFAIEDYREVYQLWKKTPGVGLRSLDDSKEGIEKFLLRNPTTNFVAIENDRIIGAILSGHDGRRGYIYHACVEEAYRKKSYGRLLVEYVEDAMEKEKITKLGLVCYTRNVFGNPFWESLGWEKRADLNYYTISLNEDNE